MGNYNPDAPYVVGNEWSPLVVDRVVLDPSIEVGYTFRAGPQPDDIDRVRVYMEPPPGQPTLKQLVASVYFGGLAAATGLARKLYIPCTSGANVAGSVLGGGAASYQAAVANPSDAGRVTLTGPNAAARFWFDNDTPTIATILQNDRILDVSVQYAVSGPLDSLPGSLTLGLERPGVLNWVMDDALTGPVAQAAAVQVRRSRLGELNPWWSPTVTPAATPARYAWVHLGAAFAPTPINGLRSLSAAGGSNIAVRIGTTGSVPGGTEFQIHYVLLEVTYGEENRAGAGGLDLSAGASRADGAFYFDIPVLQVSNDGFPVSLGESNLYAVTVGQAHGGVLSLASPVPVTLDRMGPVEPFPTHTGVVLRKTIREGSAATVERGTMLPPIALLYPDNTVEPASHVYRSQITGSASSSTFAGDEWQSFRDDVAGEYRWVKLYARCSPNTVEALRVGPLDPLDVDPFESFLFTTSISVEDFLALPDLGNGWREVLLEFPEPLVLTGGGAEYRIGLQSGADSDAPWQVLGADHNIQSNLTSLANAATYGGELAYAKHNRIEDLSSDLTLMLLRDMDPVTGFAVAPAVQDLVVVDADCDRSVGAIPTGIRYHALTWDAVNSEMVVGWGYFEVQRQDDTMDVDEWETIARIGYPQATGMDDYEARVGVETRYRARTVHRAGLGGPWTATVAVRMAAPGVTGANVDVGVLILTSNHNPAANLAYVMNWERRGPEEFTFPEAGAVELQEMYGRDYRTAFRPTERGGVEFTRTMLVNAAAVPPATLDRGFRSLRDLAWDTVPYVCVRDELKNRWLSTLIVPNGSVRRRRKPGHVHLAQMTVVEVTGAPAPVDGGDPPCEGLQLNGAVSSVQADAPTTEATLVTELAADTFARVVAPGGWGDLESPVQAWQVIQGRAGDLSVDGSVAEAIVTEYRNANPFFEVDAAGWTPFGCTALRSTLQSHEGTASLRIVPNGVSVETRVESDQATGVTVGENWRVTAWVRCSVNRSVSLHINWFDAGGGFLSGTTGPGVAVVANTWTRLSYTAAAPVGAARATFNVYMFGTPPAGNVLFIDEATIAPAPTTKRVVAADTPAQADVTVQAKVRINAAPTGSAVHASLIARLADPGDYYRGNVVFRTDGFIGLSIDKVVAGSITTIATEEIAIDQDFDDVPLVVGQWYQVQMRVAGEVIQLSVGNDGDLPGMPYSAIDADHALPGQCGLRATLADEATNTNTAVSLEFDDYRLITSPSDLDWKVELRPTGDDPWFVSVDHLSLLGGNLILGGADFGVSSRDVCVDLFQNDFFFECAAADDVGIRTRQRQWVRGIYRNNIGGGLARMDVYTSFDGVGWTLTASATGVPEPPPFEWGELSVRITGPATVMRTEWRDGEDGPLLANPDFESQPPGTVQFTDSTGLVWTVSDNGLCPAE